MDLSLREAILQLFTKADGYLSGEELSQRLGCSRTAVWKHINELRQLGYTFTARQRKGYLLTERPDILIPEEIKCFNEADRIGQIIRYADSAPSTQQIAHEWAAKGAPHGALVVAEEQTGGKGRMGRFWHSPPKSGIWMSLVLRPSIPLDQTPHLTLLVSVAVTRVLRQETEADAAIKWPNDILIKGRKVCGVLIEVRAEADRIHYCVAGAGINVHADKSMPEALKGTAIYLDEVSERPLHRARIAARCCEEIEALLDLYEKEGFSPIKSLWESHAMMLNKTVTVSSTKGVLTGKALGIADSGALLLKTKAGIQSIFSADVTTTAKEEKL